MILDIFQGFFILGIILNIIPLMGAIYNIVIYKFNFSEWEDVTVNGVIVLFFLIICGLVIAIAHKLGQLF